MTHLLFLLLSLALLLGAPSNVLAASGAAPTPVIEPAQIGIGAYRALLIGVQDYGDQSGITDLVTPEGDVRAIGKILSERYGFKDMRTLSGPKATRAEIMAAFDRLVRESKPEDAVVILYAGHGTLIKDERGNVIQGYWLPADAAQDNKANWISNADVRDVLRLIPARHVLLISDSCFAGTLLGMRDVRPVGLPDGAQEAARLTARKSRWVLASGGSDEPVLDEYRDGMSVFAYYFRQVLEEQEASFVNPGAFMDTLKKRVMNNARQKPAIAPLRDAGDEEGELVLINQGAAPDLQKMIAQEKLCQEQKALGLSQAATEWSSLRPLLAGGDASTRKLVEEWLRRWNGGTLKVSCGQETREHPVPEAQEARTWIAAWIPPTVPKSEKESHLSRPLAIAGGATLLGAAGSYLAAVLLENAAQAETDRDRWEDLATMNHAANYSMVTLGTVGTGLIVGALVVGKW